MSNFKHTSSDTGTQWPAWKIALAVGVPVAAGTVGYYLYMKSKSENNKTPTPVPEEKKTPVKKQESPGPSQVNNNNPSTASSPNTFQTAVEFKNEGNVLFKKGMFEDAILKYEKAIEICPPNKKVDLSTFYQNKAAAHEKLKQNEKVVEACTKAIDLNPRYIKALFRRSRALELLNRKTECLEDMTAVCIMEQFQNNTSMLFADRVLKDIGKEEASKKFASRKPFMPSVMFVKQYFSSFTDDIILHPLTEDEINAAECGYIVAKKALLENELDSVIENCSKTINNCDKKLSQDNEIHSSGDDSQVKENGILADEKFFAHALLLRGTFHLLMGNTTDAKVDLERIISMHDVDTKLYVNALIKRGSLNMQEQNIEMAKSDFNKAAEKDPDNTDVLHHRGQLFVLLEDPVSAIKDFDKCLQLKPDFALAHAQKCFTEYRKAVAFRDVVEETRAFAKFEEVIAKFPNCSEIYGLYAQALADKENFQEADRMFGKAIEIEPENAPQYVHRGLLCLQWKQNMEESVKYINKALEIDAKCDFAHETMGTIEVQRGNLKKACEHFEIAINLAKSEMEMAHLYSLKAAAVAQGNLAIKYGLKHPGM